MNINTNSAPLGGKLLNNLNSNEYVLLNQCLDLLDVHKCNARDTLAGYWPLLLTGSRPVP